jgi:hypothetical protein
MIPNPKKATRIAPRFPNQLLNMTVGRESTFSNQQSEPAARHSKVSV